MARDDFLLTVLLDLTEGFVALLKC